MIILGIIGFLGCLYIFFYMTNDIPQKEEQKINEEITYQKICDEERKRRGTAFEVQITQLISEKLKGALVINNCILNKKSKDGKDIYWDGVVASKEFDVLLICRKGLFVIEAKNYAEAFVSGNFNDKTWLASYSKTKVYSVYSPWKQVSEGVFTLKRYLPDFNFQRYVIFPNSTKLSENLRKSGNVLSFNEFNFKLNEIAEMPDTLSKESVKLIKDLLISENDRARKMNAEKEHLKYVNKCKENNNPIIA